MTRLTSEITVLYRQRHLESALTGLFILRSSADTIKLHDKLIHMVAFILYT